MTEKLSCYSCCPSNVTSNFSIENNSPLLGRGVRLMSLLILDYYSYYEVQFIR